MLAAMRVKRDPHPLPLFAATEPVGGVGPSLPKMAARVGSQRYLLRLLSAPPLASILKAHPLPHPIGFGWKRG
jgi:hypothetical protein